MTPVVARKMTYWMIEETRLESPVYKPLALTAQHTRRRTYHASHLENIHNIVHGHIPTKQLLPHLHRHPADSPLEQLGREQRENRYILRFVRNPRGLLHLLEFYLDNGIIPIPLPVQRSKDIKTLLPPLLTRQPPRRLGEKEQRREKNQSRNALDAPADSERSGRMHALDTSVRNQVHDENTPFDRPLLDPHDPAADARWRELSQINTYLR